MKFNNKFLVMISIALFSLFMQACYVNDEVETNQMAVQLDRNEIVHVVGAGVYTDWGFFSDLKVVDVDTQTFSVEDPQVLTQDNQSVGVRITIQARRKNDKESIENFFTNWASLIDNNKMVETITSTAREGMKNGVHEYTLLKLLDDRNGLANSISKQIEADAEKYGVEIINLTIENIAPSDKYMAILEETANLKAETEKELQRQNLIKQTAQTNIIESQQKVEALKAQLLAEEAQTQVQVEIAKRQGEVTAASNQVYVTNPLAFELEKLKLLKDIFNDKTVFYLPEGTDLTGVFGLDKLIPGQ